MRIQPMESQTARRRVKDNVKTIGSLITIMVITGAILASLGMIIKLVADFCKDAYASNYEYQIEILEAKNEELSKSIEKLKSELESKNEIIQQLQQDAMVSTQSNKIKSVPYSIITYEYNQSISWDAQSCMATNISGASAEQFNLLINQILEDRFGYVDPNHPMYDLGESFVQIEREHGVSATLILSIVTWESGFCAYEGWPDSYKSFSNCAGIMDGDDPRYFKNINECILYLGQLLGEVYINNHNLNCVNDIGVMYCESPQWGDCVESTMLNYNNKLQYIINLEEAQ